MARPLRHSWDLDFAEAARLQRRLATRVELEDRIGPLRAVAGADVSYDRGDDRLYASAVLLTWPGLEVMEISEAVLTAGFPYVPGYLSFREAPAVIEAISRLKRRPDLLLADGQGLAHPRRFGIACHLGVWLDIPSIGCGKSRLVGSHREPATRRGSRAALRDGREKIGEVVRTRDGVRPLFISPGHRVGFETARRLVLACGRGLRLPEPTRLAHLAVNRLRRRSNGEAP